MTNFQMLDLLDKAIAKDTEDDHVLLMKEGVLTLEGRIVPTKLNLMSGAYASDLLDSVVEADMYAQEVLAYIESLQQQNQYMGIYYYLLSLIMALEMDIPYLFMQLPSRADIL